MTTKKLAYLIRHHAVKMTHQSGASHIASILSVADIIAVLYGEVMKIFPDNPYDERRDRFILSKGHAGAAIYVALAELGFFPLQLLDTYYQNGSCLSGHLSHKNVPGVEFSTGSLGHGVCVASGMALAAKLDDKTHHVYTVVGDGECQEGSVWEMALFAAHNQLDNLTIIIDNNKMQALGYCEEEIGPTNLFGKWGNFGFETIECNGHDHDDLRKALLIRKTNKPVCIIAHTIKGQGVSFMENNILWHYRDPQGDHYEQAIRELEARFNEECGY
jgi:transketolase